MPQNEQTNYTKLIADTLVNKNKRNLGRFQDRCIKQALYFSAVYRDFIYKIIKSPSVKIRDGKTGEGYLQHSNSERTTLTKSVEKLIVADIFYPEILPHELGHAVDYWFGSQLTLSTTIIVRDEKTLHNIFIEEFSSCYEQIHKDVMEEYKNIINSTINADAYSIFINNLDTYKKLCEEREPRARKKLQKELYENGFMEVYSQIYFKNCYSMLNLKYGPILDALSSKYDFDHLFLSHHQPSYYQYTDEYRPTIEFFANVFRAKVTSQHTHYDNLIKYLPKSFDAFERLFVIIYDHFQNNKRFTDVPIVEKEIPIFPDDDEEE